MSRLFISLSMLSFLFAPVAYADITTGMISRYTFDEGSGVVAADSVGPNSGDLINTPTWNASAQIGTYALTFNGTDEYVNVAANASINNLTTLTLSAWVNPTSFASCGGGNAAIIEKQTFSHGWLMSCFSNGNLQFVAYTDGNAMIVSTAAPLSTSNWTHVVFVWDGNLNGANAKFYIDGVDSTTLTQVGTGNRRDDTVMPIHIGYDQYDGSYFTGSIDDVRVYSRALSSGDVTELFNFNEVGGVDLTAPVRSSGNPSGALAAGTTSVLISLNTDESATCKYGSSSNVFASLPNTFAAGVGSTTHSATVSVSNGNTYSYYVRCQDSLGNTNTNDYTITFSVNALVINFLDNDTYYIDFDSGSDSNTGTSTGSPWKHLPGDINAVNVPAAMQHIPNGSTFLLKGGVKYKGSICWNSSTPQCDTDTVLDGSVTLSGDSYPGLVGTKAIIDGSEEVINWIQCPSQIACGNNSNWQNIYYTYIEKPDYLDQPALYLNLYQGTQPLIAAQYPDSISNYYQISTNYLSVASSSVTSTSITDSRFEDFGSDLVGKYIYLWVSPNEIEATEILTYDSGTDTITFASHNLYTDRDTLYALANMTNSTVLSKAGEYYMEETPEVNLTHKVYAWPYDSSSINSGSMTYSTRSSGVIVWYPTDVTIEGFKIQKQSGDAFCDGVGISEAGSTVTSGMTIRDNEIMMGRSGVCAWIKILGVDDVIIQDNYIHDNGGGARGIEAAGDNVIIQGNTIRNSGRTPIYCSGCTNSSIIENTIVDNNGPHSNGISVYQSSDNVLIARNHVYNSELAFTFESGSNFSILNNIFEGLGVACWGACNNGILANNIIEGQSSLLSLSYLTGNWTIANNISFNRNAGSSSTNLWTDDTVAVDRTTIFENSPRSRFPLVDVEKLVSTTNVTTFYVDSIYSSIIQPGDIIIIDETGDQYTVDTVTYVLFMGNFRTRVTIAETIPVIEDGTVTVWPAGTTNFDNDFHLKENSIAIATGTNLFSSLTQLISDFPYYDFGKDFDGEGYPLTAAWDMGPFQYSSLVPDTTDPILTEVTPVPSPDTDTTPSYTFSSDEAGTISYGGSCTSGTTSASSGSNTIIFNNLAAGTYSNCTITVTDVSANASNPLSVSTFTIQASSSGGGSGSSGGGSSRGGSSSNNVSTSTNSHSVMELSHYIFTKELGVGSVGIDVIELQKILVSQGYLTYPPGITPGYFGNLTQSALARFQQAKGISPSTGYFGPKTIAFMNGGKQNIFTRDLTVDFQGSDVTALQNILISEGYLVIPPGVKQGYFGLATKQALIAFQKANNISPAMGYFGLVTRGIMGNFIK